MFQKPKHRNCIKIVMSYTTVQKFGVIKDLFYFFGKKEHID